MARKKAKVDFARTRPLSLEFLRALGALEGFVAPAGRFDPNGEWEARYRLWMVQSSQGGGCLHLRRQPGDDGVRLRVELAVAEVDGYLRRTQADLHCAADALCTPRAWQLSSQSIGFDGRTIPGTELSETGAIRDGVLEVRFGRRSRKQKLPGAATSNWSLFDVVQRLAGEKTRPLTLALLEEMDLVKPGQRLCFREMKDFELGGRKLRLCGYHQVGRGVLPWQYWVDEQGRLLLAFSGVRAWVRDPKASESMQERLDRARARQKGGRKPA